MIDVFEFQSTDLDKVERDDIVIRDWDDQGKFIGDPKSKDSGTKTDWDLLRIRNPWGSANPVEWTGQWSDGSNEVADNINA